ncbi:non-hydrolyzing UDP-N-acetylglucosamine 2-epimerase [Endozoicomonas numazuensis]|uniref:UDP-N-acetylglucosamine 2-epimerase n=1 Tax=Endozoicomonas numazuensis TaxID=1137799 RepID=A0A081N3Q8_9GAMM|nr:UDP-N-acetylglucosamine 2-epimerase (non-hydrolyzing) [Endozoicomonas numazuensis]KEQ13081.1 UDP-N-acetylglucosamine 2-epimerase [Endozoicomonas numazuensis]
MKVTTIIGARPQFIKAAVVSHAFVAKGVTETILHTGQHFDANMSDVFFDELGIPKPAHHLGIGGGSHGQNTGRMIEAIEQVLLKQRPDWVVVYGDTDSTLAGAVAAVKLHIPVAHVEAGLRSFNRSMPEEINRVLTDHTATLLFAPTQTAVQHLVSEGIAGNTVQCVGDVMYDAALYYRQRAESRSEILKRLDLQPKAYTLATIHRAENTDDPKRLGSILSGFAAFGHTIVLPLHPRTRARLASFGLAFPPNVKFIDPVGYLDMVMLEQNASLIATDSGGVQKEAFFHRVPCVTLRDETEWTELVDAGWNRLVPPINNTETVKEAMTSALGSQGDDIQPYGSGNASSIIANSLIESFEL